MQSWGTRLRFLVLGLLLIGALFTALSDFFTRAERWDPANLVDDPVTNWERRIEPVKNDLPPTGKVGYLSDWDLPGWKGGLSDMDNEYRLTQYALAPRLVVRGAGYAQIVANLSNPEDVSRIEEQFRVRKIREYGFGIYLFEGQGQ